MTNQTVTESTERSTLQRWVDAFLHRGPGYGVTPEPIADAVAAELYRRMQRLEDPNLLERARTQVSGEVLGLQSALGIVLGGRVPGGTADRLAHEYYRGWLDRAKEGR
ncbi:hypothetical protein [Streptomyces sp. NPDC046862]|uniref:hypothetical protein n=1 Tax=Streptomyces sp. NPDC046862 TaxID=3154603 RepID=UPI003454F1CC